MLKKTQLLRHDKVGYAISYSTFTKAQMKTSFQRHVPEWHDTNTEGCWKRNPFPNGVAEPRFRAITAVERWIMLSPLAAYFFAQYVLISKQSPVKRKDRIIRPRETKVVSYVILMMDEMWWWWCNIFGIKRWILTFVDRFIEKFRLIWSNITFESKVHQTLYYYLI